MKLRIDLAESVNTFMPNNLNRQLENRAFFTNAIKSFDVTTTESVDRLINVIRTSDSEEFTSMCKAMLQSMIPENAKDLFYASQILSLMLEERDVTEEQFWILVSVLKNLDNTFFKLNGSNQMDAYGNKYLNSAKAMLANVGNKIRSWKEYYENGILPTDSELCHKEYLNAMSENTIIKTGTDADAGSGADIVKQKTREDIEYLINYFRDFSYKKNDNADTEFLTAQIHNIPAYVRYVLTNDSNDHQYDSIFWLISECHSAVRRNQNGLTELYDALDVVKNDILQINSWESFEAKEISNQVLDMCDNVCAAIEIDQNNIINHRVEEDGSPLTEMGLGYFFEIIPFNENAEITEDMINALNEAAIECNAAAIIQDMAEIINEGAISDRIAELREERKEKRKDDLQRKKEAKDEKARRAVQLKERKEDLKQRQKEELADTKHQYAVEKSKEKYDTKLEKIKQKNDFKLDQAAKKHKERAENAEARKATIKNTIKAAYVQSGASAKVKTALHRAVSAGIGAAGAAAFGIPPIIGAAGGLAGSVKGTKGDRRIAERGLTIQDINSEIARIDGEIDVYREKGNTRAVANLERMKASLESSKAQIARQSLAQGGGY